MAVVRLAVWCACAVIFAGCGRPAGPSTVPVTGKVVFVKGGTTKTLAQRQAQIEFESLDQPGIHAYGEIQEDGSFTLITAKDDAGQEGAVPGNHRVKLNLDSASIRFVAPKFQSFETSGIRVKVPSDQPIEIKVWN